MLPLTEVLAGEKGKANVEELNDGTGANAATMGVGGASLFKVHRFAFYYSTSVLRTNGRKQAVVSSLSSS